jgi:hypothetical protein
LPPYCVVPAMFSVRFCGVDEPSVVGIEKL